MTAKIVNKDATKSKAFRQNLLKDLSKNKVFKSRNTEKNFSEKGILTQLYENIDTCLHHPVIEYETGKEEADDLLYLVGSFILNFLLLLVPMLYYLNYITKTPKICDYSDRNTYCFAGNETFCKNGYEAKYTFRTGYGLLKRQKKCVKSIAYETQLNRLFDLYSDKKNKLILSLRDSSTTQKSTDLLNIKCLQKELTFFSNNSIKKHYPLKKINRRTFLNTNKVARSDNKDSIFYRGKNYYRKKGMKI